MVPRAPSISLSAPASGRDRLEVGARLDSSQFAEVTFFAKTGHGGWRDIGTDDNAPYRVFHDVSGIAKGTLLEYRMVAKDLSGRDGMLFLQNGATGVVEVRANKGTWGQLNAALHAN